MKTICVAIQKGGQGKTLLAVHLAWYAHKDKKRVLFIDMDMQGNATFTLEDYKSNMSMKDVFSNPERSAKKLEKSDFTLISSNEFLADIDKQSPNKLIIQLNKFLEAISNDYDYCIIDTAPTLSSTMVAASTVSDFIVSPMELEIYSINGVSKLVQMVNNLKEVNPNIEFLGIVPNKVDFRKPRIKQNYEQLKAATGNLILDAYLSNRDSFAESVFLKQPVWKNRKSSARKAAKEVQDVAKLIFERVGG